MLKDKLIELRTVKGYKQSDMAQMLNVSKTTYFNYENHNTEPDYKTLVHLAKILDTSIDYLLENEKKEISLENKQQVLISSITQNLGKLSVGDLEALNSLINSILRK